jgi:hypothetical protein
MMKKFIFTLIFILLLSIEGFSQTITFATVGVQDMSGIDVEVEHYVPGGTTGTISSLTNNIPADRGQGTTTIFSTLNSDQGSVVVNFPSGYIPTIGTTTYATAKLHANAWLAFPNTTYNSYNSSASAPNVPTLHFTSVNNGSTDNNMSHTSTETYTDSYWGDVFRIRYEGSYRYNVQGINTKIDLYFPKNNPNKMIVVLRTFLADGSNQEQIGLSNGSTWLASNMITNATYSNGVAFVIDNATSNSVWTSQGTQTTTSTGSVTFSNPNNYQYRVNVDVSGISNQLTQSEMNYLMYLKMFPNEIASWDYHTMNFYEPDSSDIVSYSDIFSAYQLYKLGQNFNFTYNNNWVYSQSEKDDIEVNANSLTYHLKYPKSPIRTFNNLNRFYIVSVGKHRRTTNTNTITQ